jgi:phosphatidate phosphatase APP1
LCRPLAVPLSPELYREAVRRFLGRVRAVDSRNVTGRRRQAEVSKLRDALQADGLDLRLVRDSLAAQHAHALGLIAAGALPVIAAGVAEDRAARAEH